MASLGAGSAEQHSADAPSQPSASSQDEQAQPSAEGAFQALALTPDAPAELPQAAVGSSVAADASEQQQPASTAGDPFTGETSQQRLQEAAPGFQQRFFSEEALDATVHISVTDLGRQLFVWVGSDSSPPNLSNLALGILTPARPSQRTPAAASHDQHQQSSSTVANGEQMNGHCSKVETAAQESQPREQSTGSKPEVARSAVATTLVRGTGEEASVALAEKLTKRLGVPVLLSWTLPANNPLLNAWAEKRLVEILST